MMDLHLHVTPHALIHRQDWSVVDVRAEQERRDPTLGLIPGSLHWSQDQPHDGLLALAAQGPLALVCLSGRRSLELAQTLARRAEHPVASLDGGLLAWAAAGAPLSGKDIPRAPLDSSPPAALYAQLRSCFVAQLTETMLTREDDVTDNPLELLMRCFARVGCTPQQATIRQWERVLDDAAATSRRRGTPIEVIAAHLDEFLRMLSAST